MKKSLLNLGGFFLAVMAVAYMWLYVLSPLFKQAVKPIYAPPSNTIFEWALIKTLVPLVLATIWLAWDNKHNRQPINDMQQGLIGQVRTAFGLAGLIALAFFVLRFYDLNHPRLTTLALALLFGLNWAAIRLGWPPKQCAP